MESLASCTGLLPEQAWDGADLPQAYMYCGRPTGSAMPLMWAHAEYIKLLRSVRDGKVSDLIYDVAKRYLGGRADRQLFEVWKPTRQVRSVNRAMCFASTASDCWEGRDYLVSVASTR